MKGESIFLPTLCAADKWVGGMGKIKRNGPSGKLNARRCEDVTYEKIIQTDLERHSHSYG